MCGRFYVDKEKLVNWVLEHFSKTFDQQQLSLLPSKDTCPSDCSIVYSQKSYTIMKWGYEIFNHVTINTRIESISQKEYYQKDYRHNKCVVIANGFYEWDEQGQKHYLHGQQQYLFLAAIYQEGEPLNRYSIITKEATTTKNIHQRVPLLIPKDAVVDYIQGKLTLKQLQKLQVDLVDETEYEKLTLF